MAKARFKSEETKLIAEKKAFDLFVSGKALSEICDTLRIKVDELEERLLEYISKESDKEKKQELYTFMFQKQGFPRQDLLKKYCLGRLTEKEFRKVYRIEKTYFNFWIQLYTESQAIQEILTKKNEKLNKKVEYTGIKIETSRKYMTGKIIH